MKIPSIHKHTESVRAARAAYRSLIRTAYRLGALASNFERSRVEIGVFDTARKDIAQEIQLYEESPSLYLWSLSQEVRYRAREEFSYQPPQTAAELHLCLADIGEVCSAAGPSGVNLDQIIPYLLKHREKDFERSQRTAQHFVDNNTTDFNGRLPQETEEKLAWPIIKYKDQTNSQRESRVAAELKKSTREKNRLVRQYVKHLQMHNKLPIPGALPYTDIDLPSEEISLDKKIFGSTAYRAMKQAYNLRNLETFLVPEVEFKVNYHHYWEKYLDRADNKGEQKVAIRKTEAGIVPMSYLELPYPQLDDLKEIALDVKKATNVQRLRAIWEAQAPQDLVVETSNADGSYDIGWYKKYGTKSAMFPRVYHEDLATMEVFWEQLVEQLEGKTVPGSWASIYASWVQPLNETSQMLQQELNWFYQKHSKNSLRNKRLLREQLVLQKQMHRRHLRMVNALELVHSAAANTFVHDSVDAPDLPIKDAYDSYIMRDDMKVKNTRNGVPLVGVYSRSSLSYILRKFGLSHFKIGMRFKKKIDW